MLLYYTPEDFAYDSKNFSAEKIQAIVDVMKKLPTKRVMVSGMIGPVSGFLYCVGFYHQISLTKEKIVCGNCLVLKQPHKKPRIIGENNRFVIACC